jgi:hypothetical protein
MNGGKFGKKHVYSKRFPLPGTHGMGERYG